MAAVVGSERSPERTEMERFGGGFGGGGMALLPWTRQLLTVLWEQLRLLVQVIYYTFVSVFQMFRFEVHLRITDETGQHIQHMSAAANPTDSFLFSSLFDGDGGVMAGGPNPLSNFCAEVGDPFGGKTTAEALLSSLRADDLCCGLVDDFVSRTSSKEDGVFLGRQSGWNMGFPGDWSIFVAGGDCSGSSDGGHRSGERASDPDAAGEKAFRHDTSEEERSSHWSSEEDQSVLEFDSEESKALWESLSRSSDPYNPSFFTACISTNANMGKSKSEARDGGAGGVVSLGKAGEELLGLRGLNNWVCRSDSESSWSSWASSEGSSPDFDKEESDRLLEFFSSPGDPYNPMCFTACTVSSKPQQPDAAAPRQPASLAPPPRSDAEESEGGGDPPPSEDDKEEQLWKSLCRTDDPYHPLNFQARLRSAPAAKRRPGEVAGAPGPAAGKKHDAERPPKRHSHPDKTLVPWKRPGQTSRPPPEQKRGSKGSGTQKRVRFSPAVQVHVMRTWLFARQASRKGHWEEMARDRDRFRRRVREAEQAVGHCFGHAHREKMRAYLDGASRRASARPGH